MFSVLIPNYIDLYTYHYFVYSGSFTSVISGIEQINCIKCFFPEDNSVHTPKSLRWASGTVCPTVGLDAAAPGRLPI